jgi:galactokinase
MILAKAPGRINLIGEHTDYNKGFVLPMAIDKSVWMHASARDDNEIHLYSEIFDENHSFQLKDIKYEEACGWANYVKGAVKLLLERELPIGGADIRIGGDVPIRSGLSSSAALEVATCFTLKKIFKLEIEDNEIPPLCQRAENEFVGVQCGIMDQFVSVFGQENKALFLDCRSLEHRQIPFEMKGMNLMVIDTRTKRELATSEYNTRRRECEEGVEILSQVIPEIKSLRDISLTQLERKRDLLSPLVARRCEHVVRENQRVLEAVDALKKSDFEGLGRLLYESHDSLRNLYEVSCKELDLIVDVAGEFDGVLGARMTGAGFGGCVICLVREECRSSFVQQVREVYRTETGNSPEVYEFKPSDGAARLNALTRRHKATKA